MANTTFNGPVRSENGFQEVVKDAQGNETIFGLPRVARVTGVTVNETAGDSPAIGQFTQPAGTLITDIKVHCATAPTLTGSGDIGYEVGTSSSGAQIVAAATDALLDAGTTVVAGNLNQTTLVQQTQSAATAPATVQFTSTARTIYCNVTNTVNAATDSGGSFTFLITYQTLPL
jgi:hypothetical protein